jgi:hypothetical protein
VSGSGLSDEYAPTVAFADDGTFVVSFTTEGHSSQGHGVSARRFHV